MRSTKAGVAILVRQRRLVVSDATKFGCRGFVQVCQLNALSELVTDVAPSGLLSEAFGAAAVKVVIA
jgi:DeoR family glycerol-3-phosphate regulon repressor